MEDLIKAGNKLLSVMEIQERRASGEYHISDYSFGIMWDNAKEGWKNAVTVRPEDSEETGKAL